MDNNYNVDDILLEIKRRKAQKAASQGPDAPAPGFASPGPEYTPPQPPLYEPGLSPKHEPPAWEPPSPPRRPAPPEPEPYYHPPVTDVADAGEEPEATQDTLFAGRKDGFSFKVDIGDAVLPEDDSAEPEQDLGATRSLDLEGEPGFDAGEGGPRLKGLSAKGWNEIFGPDAYAGESAGASEPGDDDDEIAEYNSPDDREAILHDITTTKLTLIVRLGVTFVLALILVYLGIAKDNLDFPLPPFMLPEADMRAFMLVNLVLTVAGIVICGNMVGSGLVSLFTLKSDSDSVAAAACLGVVAQGVVLTVYPEHVQDSGVNLYFPIIMLTLLFNTLGKLMLVDRTHRNFLVVSSKRPKKAVLRLEDNELAREYTRELRQGKLEVAYAAGARHLESFLKHSYDGSYEEDISGVLAPVCVGGALLISVISFFIYGSAFISLTALSAILCVSAPFSLTLVGSMPLEMAARALSPKGGVIAGHDSVERFHDVDCVAVDATDLFPAGSVTMHGMKVFAKSRVDEAILDAASVLCSQRSTLTDIFLQMVGGREEILKKVDSVVYEDGMGISAWVDGKRVLVGSAELMRHHGINTPSRDYESRYAQGGRELLYISNSGELTAMFVVSYKADPEIAASLDYPLRRDMALLVCTIDQNLDAKKIAAMFDYPMNLVSVIDSGVRARYLEMTKERENASSMIAYTGSLPVMLRALCGAQALKWSVRMGTLVQLIGIAAGYAMMAFFAFTGGMASAGFVSLLLYQGFWLVSTVAAMNIRRV